MNLVMYCLNQNLLQEFMKIKLNTCIFFTKDVKNINKTDYLHQLQLTNLYTCR